MRTVWPDSSAGSGSSWHASAAPLSSARKLPYRLYDLPRRRIGVWFAVIRNCRRAVVLQSLLLHTESSHPMCLRYLPGRRIDVTGAPLSP